MYDVQWISFTILINVVAYAILFDALIFILVDLVVVFFFFFSFCFCFVFSFMLINKCDLDNSYQKKKKLTRDYEVSCLQYHK
jgi:hypothetical protein